MPARWLRYAEERVYLREYDGQSTALAQSLEVDVRPIRRERFFGLLPHSLRSK